LLKKVSASYRDEWKEWGIYDMIILSAIDMHWPQDVWVKILGFWSIAIKGFMLPKAMAGLTLLNVVAILNLSIHGEELRLLYGT